MQEVECQVEWKALGKAFHTCVHKWTALLKNDGLLLVKGILCQGAPSYAVRLQGTFGISHGLSDKLAVLYIALVSKWPIPKKKINYRIGPVTSPLCPLCGVRDDPEGVFCVCFRELRREVPHGWEISIWRAVLCPCSSKHSAVCSFKSLARFLRDSGPKASLWLPLWLSLFLCVSVRLRVCVQACVRVCMMFSLYFLFLFVITIRFSTHPSLHVNQTSEVASRALRRDNLCAHRIIDYRL